MEQGLDVKDPATLEIEGISHLNDWIQWNIIDSADPQEGALDVGSSGSLVLTIREYEGGEFPECTWLQNQVIASGISQRNDIPVNVGPVTVTHLAGSDIFDKSFLSSQLGNIHSNLNICLQNVPAPGAYIGDYFITSTGGDSNISAQWSRAEESFPYNPQQEQSGYVKESFPNIPLQTYFSSDFDNIDYADIEAMADVVHEGDCAVNDLFGPTPVSLNGLIYHCKDNGGGAGNLTIDEELIITNNGGTGTILVDGNLYIKDDIYYSNDPIASIDDLAVLGWIVKGDIIIEEYVLADNVPYEILPGVWGEVPNCWPYADYNPEGKWCQDFNLVVDQDQDGDMDLSYSAQDGTLTVGPIHIVGTFFAAGEIQTGSAHLPLEVQGSLIANDVVLERREFPD